jgi:hypothetical protein
MELQGWPLFTSLSAVDLTAIAASQRNDAAR